MSIEAMKLALEVLEINLIFLRNVKPFKGQEDLASDCIAMTEEAIASLRQAIEQAQKQEPVAWRGYNWGHSPDDWVYRDFDDPILDGNGNNVGRPLYTSPPQRQWVGLTDEELREIIYETGFGLLMNVWFYEHEGNPRKVLQAIEAKLKEKNT